MTSHCHVPMQSQNLLTHPVFWSCSLHMCMPNAAQHLFAEPFIFLLLCITFSYRTEMILQVGFGQLVALISKNLFLRCCLFMTRLIDGRGAFANHRNYWENYGSFEECFYICSTTGHSVFIFFYEGQMWRLICRIIKPSSPQLKSFFQSGDQENSWLIVFGLFQTDCVVQDSSAACEDS